MLAIGARWRAMAVGAAVVGAGIIGCSEPGGSIELQVISGITNQPDAGIVVFIETPEGDATGPHGIGDQTDSDNWATFDVDLSEGDEVDIAVRDAEGVLLVSGTCVVDDAAALEYARIFVYLNTQPRSVSCDEGFIHTF